MFKRNNAWSKGRSPLVSKVIIGMIAMVSWGAMPQMIAAQPSGAPSSMQVALSINPEAPEVVRDLVELENTLHSAKVNQELRALPPLSIPQNMDRFLAFRHHKQDASWVSTEPDEPAQVEPVMSPTVMTLFQYGLSPMAGMVPAHNVKAAIMSQMTQEQAWTALDRMENEKSFGASARLALAMLERESTPLAQEILTLVAARATWMQEGRATAQYQELIEQACNASEKSVAASAQLWREAVNGPQTAEGLLLANQIWTVLWVDLSRIQRGGELARTVARQSKTVYERELLKNTSDSAVKEQKLGRLIAAISRFAFQAENLPQMKWAVDAASQLTQARAEDKFYPRYNYAMDLFSHDNYDKSIEEFGKVFFSGIPADVTADAGIYIARSNSLKGDEIGALAALDMTVKLYREQTRVMSKAKAMRETLRQTLGVSKEQEVSQYIERHYRVQLDRALAQKARQTPARDMAMN